MRLSGSCGTSDERPTQKGTCASGMTVAHQAELCQRLPLREGGHGATTSTVKSDTVRTLVSFYCGVWSSETKGYCSDIHTINRLIACSAAKPATLSLPVKSKIIISVGAKMLFSDIAWLATFYTMDLLSLIMPHARFLSQYAI